MDVIIKKEDITGILLTEKCIEFSGKLNDAALIRNFMGVGDSTFKPRLGYKDTTVIGIQGIPEYIEQEIPFTHKADAERCAVFRL